MEPLRFHQFIWWAFIKYLSLSLFIPQRPREILEEVVTHRFADGDQKVGADPRAAEHPVEVFARTAHLVGEPRHRPAFFLQDRLDALAYDKTRFLMMFHLQATIFTRKITVFHFTFQYQFHYQQVTS